jgi:glyoxylase-like metal-dependent hydrolase (beta-lactamase superfamily II)
MFRVEMLPAGPGDCLWIEYGDDPAAPNTIIIDGGDRGGGKVLRQRIARALEERGVDGIDVELLIVTHIDNDHIVGIVELLGVRPKAPVRIGDIWFNGRKHMDTLLGTEKGDVLGQLLAKPGMKWNKAFSGMPVMFGGEPV